MVNVKHNVASINRNKKNKYKGEKSFSDIKKYNPIDEVPITTESKMSSDLPNSTPLDNGTPKNHKKTKKDLCKITKTSLVTRSGRLKKKSKEKLKVMNNILKSELLIEDSISDIPKPKKKKSKSKTVSINNNNSECKDKEEKSKPTHINPRDILEKMFIIHDKLQTKKPVLINGSKNKRTNNKQKKEPPDNRTIRNEEETIDVIFNSSLFGCDYCKKTFNSKSSLRRHIFVHLDLRPYPCNYCSLRFRQSCNLRVHISRKHLDNPVPNYTCKLCDKTFLLEENLQLHMEGHVKTENSYLCAFCRKKFSQHTLLSKHEKLHLNTSRYECSICGMTYDSPSRLSLHVKSHLNIKDYICHLCGKEFLRLTSIRRHVEMTHGGIRIQCPICFKQLKGHMTEHMRTHENTRPHECPDCGQRFTQSTQLTVHRRSHSGVRPYPCRICGRPFSHSNALMLHVRRHTGEKPFPCAMCPLAFSQLPHMKTHMNKIHGKADPYKCSRCGKFFKLKAQLQQHSGNCRVGEKKLSFEEQLSLSVQAPEIDSAMSLSRMRLLLAILLKTIASDEKLKVLA